MAQKTHPRALRQGISYNTTNNVPFLFHQYSQNLQKHLTSQDIIMRFYKKCGFQITNLYTKLQHGYYYVYVDLNPLIKNSKEHTNSKNFEFSHLISKKNHIKQNSLSQMKDFWKKGNLFCFYTTPYSSEYIWNAEKHILSKVLYRLNKTYTFIIKSNLATKNLISSRLITSRLLADHIQQQIKLSSDARQKTNIKTYLDRLVKESQKISTLKGIRIQIKGRFSSGGGGKAGRSQKEVSSWGQVPLQTLTSYIDYSYTSATTKLGLCSIKTWVHQKI